MGKRKCVFGKRLKLDYPCFEETNLEHVAYCTVCCAHVSVAHKGRMDLDQHLVTKKHQSALQLRERANPVIDYFMENTSKQDDSYAVVATREANREYSNYSSSKMDLKAIVDVLNKIAPPQYAEEWDNIGLLVEPSRLTKVQNMLLTNDLTESVLQEAISKNVQFILSYHPPIFKPLKSLTMKSWKERIVISCIEYGIAVYSPHTALDSVRGGVNDWILKAFDIKSARSLNQPSRPSPKDKQTLPVNENLGVGRIAELQNPLTIHQASECIKRHFDLARVRLALGVNQSLDTPINTVAACAGSGGTVLRGVQADLFLTGEMSHHEVLDAVHQNTSVILCEHSNTERGFLRELSGKLENDLGPMGVNILISQTDGDPLHII